MICAYDHEWHWVADPVHTGVVHECLLSHLRVTLRSCKRSYSKTTTQEVFSLTKPLNQCLIWCIYHIFNVAGTSSFHAWLVVSYEWQRQTTGVQWYQHQSVGMLIVKITMVLVFPSAHSFGSKITRLAHFRFRTLTMQMCCWIVDLNYITLNYIIVTL